MRAKELRVNQKVRIEIPMTTVDVDGSRHIPAGEYTITAFSEICMKEDCKDHCNGAAVLDGKYPFCGIAGWKVIEEWIIVLPNDTPQGVNIFEVL